MVRLAARAIRIIAGVILILFGIIAGFIPILQGWIFILAGLALLGIKPHQIKEKYLDLKARWWDKRESTPDQE
jgi:hypothetical protein